MIELQGISAGQLSLVLTQYTPLETSTQHTADITNAAAIAALQGQVAALPVAPDLTLYALASDLAAAEGLIAANASGLTAVNTSLTLGLASKASQSALDALQVEVDGKSTPASVDLKLSNHPTTAAMNSSIASANNATLASVATTYALKSVVDQLALDVAARQTAGDVAQAIATALLPLVSTSDLTAAVNLRTTPADVSQLIATALLPFVQQAPVDAALALRDSRLDGHDTDILALQNAGPFATAGDLNTLQLTLQSAIDGILAEISTLGGATNLVNAPAWLGNVTWDLLAGTNQIRNLHATGPLSIQLANDDWTLSFGCDAYTTQQTDDAISTALSDYFTRTEVTVTVVAAVDESKGYTDTQLADYSTTAQMTQAISDALVPFGTVAQRDAAISLALEAYYTSAQTDAAIAAGLATIDLTPYYTSAQTDAAIAAAVALSKNWTGGPTFNLLRGSNVLRNLSVAGALTASFQNLDDTILIESDSYARSETDGRSDHRRHRRPQLVPVPDRGAGAGPHHRRAGALLGPNGGLDLRGGRAGQLRHQQLGDLGHLLGPVQLRRQQPGRFQDYHGSAGFLHPGRSRSADHKRPGERGSEQLLHAGRDAELRGQRAARVLPSDRAGFPAHGHVHPILDFGANANGDQRRHRRRGLPDPSAGRQKITSRSAPTQASSPWCAPTSLPP